MVPLLTNHSENVLIAHSLSQASSSYGVADNPAECNDSALVSTSAPLQLGFVEAAGGRQVVAHNAAEYLALRREYKGLETPLTGEAR